MYIAKCTLHKAAAALPINFVEGVKCCNKEEDIALSNSFMA
jgi:hypothetical protein